VATLRYNYDFGSFVLGASWTYDKTDIDSGQRCRHHNRYCWTRARAKIKAATTWATLWFTQPVVYRSCRQPSMGDEDGSFYGYRMDYKIQPMQYSVGAELLRAKFDDVNGDCPATILEATHIQTFVVLPC